MIIWENVIIYTSSARILSIVQLMQMNCSVFKPELNQEMKNPYSLSNQAQSSKSTCYPLWRFPVWSVSGQYPFQSHCLGQDNFKFSSCRFTMLFFKQHAHQNRKCCTYGLEIKCFHHSVDIFWHKADTRWSVYSFFPFRSQIFPF